MKESLHVFYPKLKFVYTNIIENQHVGSQMVRLLRILNVNDSNNNSLSKTFDFPHYLSLDTNYVENIRMYVKDSVGNKIKFSDPHSRVVYKLHFRAKNI